MSAILLWLIARSTLIKWQILRHNGVAFPPEYTPRGLETTIQGRLVRLDPLQEEMLMAWAKKIGTPYVDDPVFQENFLYSLSDSWPDLFGGIRIDDIDWQELLAIAQSVAALGGEELRAEDFSRHWMHHGFVEIDSEKMSKSLGNFFTVRQVLEKFDAEAVRRMWQWLKPGGRLLLTVPCAATESEQYINSNEYGVLAADGAGFVFWQRLYDEARLEASIYSITGAPVRQQLYGEKVAGTFLQNASQKRAGYATTYPFWREPYMMSRDYAYFHSLADLPGEGVIDWKRVIQICRKAKRDIVLSVECGTVDQAEVSIKHLRKLLK